MWGDIDEKFWSTVQLTWNQIWFFATYQKSVQVRGDQLELMKTVLFAEKAQLDALVNAGEKIVAVYIVTPAHVNGGTGWEIERLSKVKLAQEPSMLPQPVHLYETISGRHYTDSMLGTRWEDLLLKGSEISFECKVSNLPHHDCT